MLWIITKYFITAGVVVIVSEVAKRSEPNSEVFVGGQL